MNASTESFDNGAKVGGKNDLIETKLKDVNVKWSCDFFEGRHFPRWKHLIYFVKLQYHLNLRYILNKYIYIYINVTDVRDFEVLLI